ncbi:hypothetical protein RHSIM_Rhsim05G0030600 [Rhododendron simsii]|uniref:Uncharacterized protein n=1 Tax=Rhododendron simsii TaxID=118357 RepID=A0A834H127_RHOSS|nr:hypothetical protein RHSIM_Rhsim05G0030600 [Rhododendron simsii]
MKSPFMPLFQMLPQELQLLLSKRSLHLKFLLWMGIADAIVDLVSSGTTSRESKFKRTRRWSIGKSGYLKHEGNQSRGGGGTSTEPNIIVRLAVRPGVSVIRSLSMVFQQKTMIQAKNARKMIGGSGVLILLTYIFDEEPLDAANSFQNMAYILLAWLWNLEDFSADPFLSAAAPNN